MPSTSDQFEYPDKPKCEECGEEIVVYDVKDVPPTCGKLTCAKNNEYRGKRWSDHSTTIPSPEDARTWKS